MASKYECIMWLEVHVKLNSPNKLFCQCKNEQNFDKLKPNTHVCPTCMGMPGWLPVLNQEPLEKAVLLGYALNCDINKTSKFERKSYFYPDSPISYQITQLEKPTNVNWTVKFFTDNYNVENEVRINRAHIEADAGKTIHDWPRGVLDFNRCSTPLVEIVTEPDFRSSEQVVEFLKELQRRIQLNNIGYADLEKWQMRCDVNLSIRPKWSDEYGKRVEIKNMNSFGAIQKAIKNEYKRQLKLVKSWWSVDQQTRWRNDEDSSSYVMRTKEEELDYRYFPEPDLPPVKLEDETLEKIQSQLKSSSFERIKRYKQEYNFNKEYINAVFQSTDVNEYFEDCISQWANPTLAVKWISSYINRFLNKNSADIQDLKFNQKQFVDFLSKLENDKLQRAQAKKVIKEMLNTGKNPEVIIKEKWLKPIDKDKISSIVDEVIQENQSAIEDIQNGKQWAIGYLIGQVMQKSKWKANPKQAKKMLQDKINS